MVLEHRLIPGLKSLVPRLGCRECHGLLYGNADALLYQVGGDGRYSSSLAMSGDINRVCCTRLLTAPTTCGRIAFTASRKPSCTSPGRPLKATGSTNKSCNQSIRLSGSVGGSVPRNAMMIPFAFWPTRQALIVSALMGVGVAE